MDTGNLALLIPIIGVSIPIIAIWTKHKRDMLRMELEATAEKSALYANRNAELEERVRVLERIVTDKGYDTALQIEALRDQREVESQRAPSETRQ
ncbi:hypothetical protein [Novosphingobium album (ex Hu et al. 2023)]|uniref:Envelope stress response membrane protein PspB n=1 Tax=Novosphingobium album (ex Hu et al. 2023) TaxID=2930093 RepID=A0ABT0AZQ5_9SPHN|nr:hypothetical protein [Novosphingobium album (ex Hu et al. 2023)]MCJ2178125.1 hypothetical protein [Novosphingobium album (ex Hu et al. 2023)]